MSNQNFKSLLESWNLKKFIDIFEDEGWDDIDTWDDLLANNCKELITLGMKRGHISKFSNGYKKYKESFKNNEKKDDDNITIIKNKPMGEYYINPKTNKIEKGFYVLPTIKSSSNKKSKYYKNFTKKSMIISNKRHKVILVVGQTGAGKTTVLNSMINYIYNIQFSDNFRYKLVVEKFKKGGQSVSQTDHVTSYELPDKNSILKYNLTVVDTPGFGDTRGVDQDMAIMKDIKLWFEKKLDTLDAVCFVVKSADSRLTPTQKYIFSSILNLFGNDIKNNIFVLITFADTSDPPAIIALKEDKIPYQKYFKLNNSVFFKDPLKKRNNSELIFDKLYWEMGMACFKLLFDELVHTHPVSLKLCRRVLQEREIISSKIEILNKQLDIGLSHATELAKQKVWVKAHENAINANKEEPYYEPKIYWDPVSTGNSLVTTCKTCPNQTCHRDCGVSNKAHCWAMTNGKCRICGCPDWNHENRNYVWERKSKQVRKTKWDDAPDMKNRFNEATQKKTRAERILNNCNNKLKETELFVQNCIVHIKNSMNALSKIALNKNLLTTKDYIDKVIKAEKENKTPGWQNRVISLQKIAEEADVAAKIQKNQFSFRKIIGWFS